MREYIFALITLFLPAIIGAITFERWYGGSHDDGGYSVQQTSDGGYIIAGYTDKEGFPFRNWDVLLIKVDSLGNIVWTEIYGDSLEDAGSCVRQCKNGDYIVVGVTYSYYGGNSVSDVFLLKVDLWGDTIWTKTYGGTGWDKGYSVIESHDGGYIIVGSTTSYGAGGADIYLLKVDTVGDEVWSRTFGGSSAQVGRSIQETKDGGYIIAGSSIAESPDSDGVFLVKTDSLGNSAWERFYGDDLSSAYSIKQTTDRGYIVCGHKADFDNGGWEVWLLKTDSLGDTIWTKSYGGYSEDWGYSVQQTSDTGYVIAGHTWSYGAGSRDVYLIKTDKIGNVLWARTYGGSDGDGSRSVQIANDGGYVIVGSTQSYGSGGSDVYLIKTDGAGVVQVPEEDWSAHKSSQLVVGQVFPNPSAGGARIHYILQRGAHVSVAVYDILGRNVALLMNEEKTAGLHTVVWDSRDNSGRKVPSGPYFLRFEAEEYTATRKVSVMR